MSEDVTRDATTDNATQADTDNATVDGVATDSKSENSDHSDEDKAVEGKAKELPDDKAEKSDEDGEGEDDHGVGFSVDDFEMPEGFEADESIMEEFLSITNNKELDTKEQNQALINLYAKTQQESLDAQVQHWDDTRKEWQSQAKADKEIGGKKFDENMAIAQKALTKFGSKELKEFGEQYGWADNPEYLKMLVRVGKTISEDSSAQGDGGSQVSIESRWYGADDK